MLTHCTSILDQFEICRLHPCLDCDRTFCTLSLCLSSVHCMGNVHVKLWILHSGQRCTQRFQQVFGPIFTIITKSFITVSGEYLNLVRLASKTVENISSKVSVEGIASVRLMVHPLQEVCGWALGGASRTGPGGGDLCRETLCSSWHTEQVDRHLLVLLCTPSGLLTVNYG